MTDAQAAKLRALAERAASRGDWYEAADFDWSNLARSDAAYMLAASPDAILGLLDRLERAESLLKELGHAPRTEV